MLFTGVVMSWLEWEKFMLQNASAGQNEVIRVPSSGSHGSGLFFLLSIRCFFIFHKLVLTCERTTSAVTYISKERQEILRHTYMAGRGWSFQGLLDQDVTGNDYIPGATWADLDLTNVDELGEHW